MGSTSARPAEPPPSPGIDDLLARRLEGWEAYFIADRVRFRPRADGRQASRP